MSSNTDHAPLSLGWGLQRHRLFRLGAAFVVGLALLWLGGLIAFVGRINQEAPAVTARADGIVVLTGGAERLNVALELLRRGQAERLLITGVHPTTGPADLTDTTSGTAELFDCCVDLGRSAQNTRGNALEAAEWASGRGYHRLIIVTANYHMPRSLLEFRAAMPSTTFIPNPVAPPNLNLRSWWRFPGTTSLLAGEYTKYLLALVRHGPGSAPDGLRATNA